MIYAKSYVQKLRLQCSHIQQLLLLKRTVFGLFWLFSGGILAHIMYPSMGVHLAEWIYLILAFCCARFSGMCLNHLIDFHYDAKNPRTMHRPLPRGVITPFSVGLQATVYLGLFFVFASRLNPLCFLFSFGIGTLIFLYSFTKRYTHFCHFILAMIHFSAPLCAFVAMTGFIALPPFFLSFAVLFIIAADDIIYSCQDVDFDTSEGLYSIPSSLGVKTSLQISELLHFLSLICLIGFALSAHLSCGFYVGIFLCGIMLFLAHLRLKAKSLTGAALNDVFVLSNTISGAIVLVFLVGELIWRVSS